MTRQLSLSAKQSPLWAEQCDPRLRLLAVLWLALVTSTLQQPLALLLMLGLVLVLASSLNLPWRRLGKRLLALESFMLILLLMLPFSVPGEPLFTLVGFTASVDGFERGMVVLLRANCVVISLLALVGTLEPEQIGHALGRLRLPDKLVHLLLMTVRYLFVLQDEYRRLHTAMRARAFVPGSNRHTWRSYGWLVGMLLVRSLERGQRVAAAMKCRGFQGRFYLLDDYRWQARDTRLLLVFMVITLTPLVWEQLL